VHLLVTLLLCEVVRDLDAHPGEGLDRVGDARP
jgi:hypothetical protein